MIANVLVEVASHFGTNQKNQAAALRKDLQEWYKKQPREVKDSKIQGKLTWERLRTKSDWPKLKCKGVATRHLAAYAAELASRFNSGSIHDRRRQAVCDLLVRFYEIVEKGPSVLSDELQSEMAEIGRLMLGTYFALSQEAVDNGVRAWKATPKFHLFMHLCLEQCRVWNPRHFWCYADEDLQRHIAEIAESCSSLRLVPVVLHKWIILAYEC